MVLAWFCLMPPRASQSNNQCDEQSEQSDTQRAALTQHTTANSEGLEGCAQAAIALHDALGVMVQVPQSAQGMIR